MSAVLLEVTDHVAVVTLNRAERKNSMNVALLDAFAERMEQLHGDPDVRAVVITGAGKAFCAGADFTALSQLSERVGGGATANYAALRAMYDAFLTVNSLEVPTIAAVNGAAVGGGLGLMLLCDLRIVAEKAKIGANFARLGIHPGLGISARLPDLVGEQAAAEMLYTGELIRGERAAAIGLALEAVSADEVLPRAIELASRIARAAPLSVRRIKQTLRVTGKRDLSAVLELEAFAQAMLSQTADAREGISAMLARREPKFEGR